MSIIIKSVSGEKERLTDYKSLQRKREVNGAFTFSFYVPKTDKNEHAYKLVENENIVIHDGIEYVIKRINSGITGNKPRKQVSCELKLYNDLMSGWQYKTLTGALQITTAMGHALEGTGVTFSIHGTFKSVEFENFGDNNPFALVQTIVSRYGAEFIPNGNHIAIYERIGQTTNSQFRYRYNIGTIGLESDTQGFATYIKGFGAEGVEVEYTSPLAAIYGIIHAEPVRDDRFTNPDTLLDECKSRLNDQFTISIEVDYVEVKKNGLNVNPFELGDSLLLIHGELELKDRVRVLSITDYPESEKQPTLTIANIIMDARDILAESRKTSKTVERVVDPNGTVRNTALTPDAQYTIDSVNRTFAQVDYTEGNGLVVRDAVNFMRFLAFKKGGLFRSLDGNFLENLINPDGINLEFVRGLLGEQYVRVGPQTTFAEGYDASQKAPLEHNHNTIYYTKEEIDTMNENNEVEAFNNITLQNGWTGILGMDWDTPGYYKDRERVYMRGSIANGTLGTVAATLPTGYRPPKNVVIGGITINKLGEIIINSGDTSNISFDTISFRV